MTDEPATPCDLLPARATLDAPTATAITGLGICIILAPWSVPGEGGNNDHSQDRNS
jgi:hypothetical protein